jgi:hypothetical protein
MHAFSHFLKFLCMQYMQVTLEILTNAFMAGFMGTEWQIYQIRDLKLKMGEVSVECNYFLSKYFIIN